MQFTISIIGAQNTGKTAFIAAILGKSFQPDNFEMSTFKTTKGVATFTTIEKHLDNPDGYFVFFDKFSENSLVDAFKTIIKLRRTFSGPIVLIGSKSDIGGNYPTKMFNKIAKFCKTYNIESNNVSARSRYCINQPFQYILGDAKILDDWKPNNAMEAKLLSEFDSLASDDAKTEIVTF
jgi:GTPase SAR1 family protein